VAQDISPVVEKKEPALHLRAHYKRMQIKNPVITIAIRITISFSLSLNVTVNTTSHQRTFAICDLWFA